MTSPLGKSRIIVWAPVLAIAIYLGLTLLTINRFSIWHDESYSATLIETNFTDIINRTGLDVHPPFYYLLLKLWSLVVGDSILALRLLSTICMTGAILVTWLFFKKIYGETAGLITLFGMSIGSFLIRYGQEMRMYSLGALLAACSTLILWKLLFETTSKARRYWLLLAYVLISTAAIYTHYFLFFLLVAHGLFVLQTRIRKDSFSIKGALSFLRRLPWDLIAALLAPFILFLPWVPTVLAQFGEVRGSFWISPLKVETLTSTVVNFFSFMQQWELVHATSIYGLAVLIICPVVMWRWFRSLGKESQKQGARLVGYLFVVPVLLLLLVSLPPLQPAYQDRYLVFYAPFLYGAFALSITNLVWRTKAKVAKLAAIFCVVILLVGVVSVSNAGNNQGWRPFPHFTMEPLAQSMLERAPEARIVSTSLWTFLDAHIVFKSNQTLLYAPNGVGKHGNGSAVFDRNDLIINQLTSLSGPIWLIQEANEPEIDIPAGWVSYDFVQAGYAKATLYHATSK